MISGPERGYALEIARFGFPGEIVLIAGIPGPGDGPQRFPLAPGFIHRICSIKVTLTTSAVVATRILVVQPAISGQLVSEFLTNSGQAAGATVKWTYMFSGGVNVPATTHAVVACGELWLPQDSTLNMVADNGDAGDVWSLMFMVAMRWPIK